MFLKEFLLDLPNLIQADFGLDLPGGLVPDAYDAQPLVLHHLLDEAGLDQVDLGHDVNGPLLVRVDLRDELNALRGVEVLGGGGDE